ncbi:MAG TPA: thioredoxin family protein [Smithella sp.]|nr:thioredoxin family protein [Smithella sp.]HRS97477.1 thioredoxin family protein [Smithella sp.]
MRKIEILGTGCAKCNNLEAMVLKALKETGVEAQVDHVKDIKKIMNYGVMTTPALVIDGEVKAAGKIPSEDQIKNWIGVK